MFLVFLCPLWPPIQFLISKCVFALGSGKEMQKTFILLSSEVTWAVLGRTCRRAMEEKENLAAFAPSDFRGEERLPLQATPSRAHFSRPELPAAAFCSPFWAPELPGSPSLCLPVPCLSHHALSPCLCPFPAHLFDGPSEPTCVLGSVAPQLPDFVPGH